MTFLTPRAAAAFLGLSVRTLARYRSGGKGPVYYKFGRTVRYMSDDLRQWATTRPSDRGSGDAGPPPNEESLEPRPGPR
ncbi:MAG: helix-turn-helix domain-containing protein [Rhodospirillales bacterium]|nr:helix-turn-helix domain-containing protein [Rhodospirillales bacterium]